MIVADVADYRWLTGDEAAQHLEAAAAETDPLALAVRLRKSLPPTRTALVAEQVQLRRKARKKFPSADPMFFTERGLQQATDFVTASFKAQRFAKGEIVADICCGIGGDLLALGARGDAVGYDADELTALLADANCRAAATSVTSFRGRAVAARAGVEQVAEVAAWHIDPDRRPQGRRTTQVELHEPGIETIESLLTSNANAAVKLAPGSEPPAVWQSRAEWEWLSYDGEAKQLCGWFGNLSSVHGLRRATALYPPHRNIEPCSIEGRADEDQSLDDLPMPASDVRRYVYEPDAAVLAAHLVGTVAAKFNLQPLAAGSAYLTSDQKLHSGLLATFEVFDQMPFDLRKVKARLAELDVGHVEIKKRGVEIDVERLARVFRSERADPLHRVALILARRGDRVTALFTRRCAAPAA
ncbi:MAG: hypothetical protein QM775_30565 [Pirellulales bacterium]